MLMCDTVTDELSSWVKNNVDKGMLRELKKKYKHAEDGGHDQKVDFDTFVTDTAAEIYSDGDVCDELRGLLGQLSSWNSHPSRYLKMQETHRSGLRGALRQLARTTTAVSTATLKVIAA